MPALSFKKRFRHPVEQGLKTHTIRAKRKRAWKVGDDLALFTGMRTEHCERIFNAPCIRVQDITITVRRRNTRSPRTFSDPPFGRWLDIVIDGERLSADEAEAFALCDGFTGSYEMWMFWRKEHGKDGKGFVFRGDVIWWDYARRYMPQPKVQKVAA